MTREEAIKRIKAWNLDSDDREVLEVIIPELHESDDERARKALIEVLHRLPASAFDYGAEGGCIGATKEQMLAYLEKQKEQKPNIELIQRSWYMEGYRDREFGKEPKWILKTGEGGPKHELNPRYGQPLVEKQKPTEEQLHNLNEAIKGLRMDGCERMADSLHSLYDILLKRNKEQSEEPKIAFGDWGDKEKKEAIITCLRYMRFIKKITNQEYEDLVRWFEDNLVANVLEKDGWTIASEQTDIIKEDYYGAFLRGEMRGYLRAKNEQKPVPFSCGHENGKSADYNEYKMLIDGAEEFRRYVMHKW